MTLGEPHQSQGLWQTGREAGNPSSPKPHVAAITLVQVMSLSWFLVILCAPGQQGFFFFFFFTISEVGTEIYEHALKPFQKNN